MLQRVRQLAGQSFIYGLGTILIQGIAFFLIPLYTRYLTPEAYGILSVTSAVTSVLLSVVSMGLPTAGLRFYFETPDEQQKRSIIGTVWLTSLFTAIATTLIFMGLGPFVSRRLFPDVPYHPYLTLALAITFSQAIKLLPLAFFRARENAVRFVVFSTGTFLVTGLLSILLVAVLKLGAHGALLARLLAYSASAAAATWLLLQYARLDFRFDVARAALLFGAPLVPAGMFAWVLRLSDRVLMQSYVSLADIGVYTLGYQLGETVSMLGTAINAAWSPFYFRMFEEYGEDAPAILAPIITYFILVTVFSGLTIALLAPEIIRLLAQPAYSAAHLVTPWIAASSVVRVFNWITHQGIIYAKKTYWEPLLSLVGGSVNIGLNLLLLPRVGYLGAAWATLIGYSVIGLIALLVSQRIRPMVYECRRLGLLVLLALVIFLAGHFVALSPSWLSVAGRVALLSLYPVLLWVLGFTSRRERKAVKAICVRIRQRLCAHS